MSVIFHVNQKHKQLSDNPEGKYLLIVILCTASAIWLGIAINRISNRLAANPKAVVMSVESGSDHGATEVVRAAQNDPAILKPTLRKDGTLMLGVSNAVDNKQLIAVSYKKLARLKRSTTIKTVIVESADGDRSSPEFP
ncbi:hypothetical protein [Mucilaginibacter ginkgonis]|uniref:Uncharacterized protein n=1 Tax=Mucilaginibacter ginkgonis TaxID=2682091 RepID=A0A6I4I5M7_9SPHI|nr:hypothetical protein [Mucilaginibacter ginkgonis]QQL48478.1 hypothetical protein GO620_009770 [Mucilaginibacter ginkgonis]